MACAGATTTCGWAFTRPISVSSTRGVWSMPLTNRRKKLMQKPKPKIKQYKKQPVLMTLISTKSNGRLKTKQNDQTMKKTEMVKLKLFKQDTKSVSKHHSRGMTEIRLELV